MKFCLMIAGILLSTFTNADNKEVATCDTSVSRSISIINQLLADVDKSYRHTGGGGITDIKQTATNTYVISIAQEERIDKIQYRVKLDKSCKLSILDKSETPENFY